MGWTFPPELLVFGRVGTTPILTRPIATAEDTLFWPLRVDNILEAPIDTYYMWVSPHEGAGTGIYLYTAPDLEGPWDIYSQIPIVHTEIIVPGNASHIGSPCVVWNETTSEFYLYFHGGGYFGSALYEQATWMARSPDGINFTLVSDTPIIAPVYATWEGELAAYPNVIRVSATDWRMWYSGNWATHDPVNYNTQIGYATSTDGLTWTKYEGNPVFGPDRIKDYITGIGSILIYEGEYYWYYSGIDNTGANTGISIAKITDNVSFERYSGNPIFIPRTGAWDSGITACPQMYYDDETLYLFYAGGLDDIYTSNIGLATQPFKLSPQNLQQHGLIPDYSGASICTHEHHELVPPPNTFDNTGTELLLLKHGGVSSTTHIITVSGVGSGGVSQQACFTRTLSPDRGEFIGPFIPDIFGSTLTIEYDNPNLYISILRDVPY